MGLVYWVIHKTYPNIVILFCFIRTLFALRGFFFELEKKCLLFGDFGTQYMEQAFCHPTIQQLFPFLCFKFLKILVKHFQIFLSC
jgi:hypothetical protein